MITSVSSPKMSSFCHGCYDHVGIVFSFLDEQMLSRIERVSNEFRRWVTHFRQDAAVYQHCTECPPNQVLKYPRLRDVQFPCLDPTIFDKPQFHQIRHLTICVCENLQKLRQLQRCVFMRSLETLVLVNAWFRFRIDHANNFANWPDLEAEDKQQMMLGLHHLDVHDSSGLLAEELYRLIGRSPNLVTLHVAHVSDLPEVEILNSLRNLRVLGISCTYGSLFFMLNSQPQNFPQLESLDVNIDFNRPEFATTLVSVALVTWADVLKNVCFEMLDDRPRWFGDDENREEPPVVLTNFIKNALELANLDSYTVCGDHGLFMPIAIVRSVALRKIDIYQIADSDLRKVFQNCPLLEEVILMDARDISSKTFSYCSLRVRDITLIDAHHLSDHRFAAFIRRCQNLYEFYCRSTNLGDRTFQALTEHRHIHKINMVSSKCTGKYTHLLSRCHHLKNTQIETRNARVVRKIIQCCPHLEKVNVAWANLAMYGEFLKSTSLRKIYFDEVSWNVLGSFPIPPSAKLQVHVESGIVSSHVLEACRSCAQILICDDNEMAIVRY